MDASAQYALAYALTTTTGIRALLPLALVSIAAHFGYIHAPAQFNWLGSTSVTVVLIAMAAVEVLADKIPLVDHALHFVQIVTKPAAAAIVVAGVAHPQSHDALIALMVVGALNALGVHAFTSSTRVASTATTGGIANPFLSVFEDGGVIALSLLAFVAPFIAAVLCVVVVVIMVWVARRATAFVRSRSRS